MIKTNPLGYFLEQNKYSENIDKIPSDYDFNPFKNARHLLVWITQTRPETLSSVKMLSQVTKKGKGH